MLFMIKGPIQWKRIFTVS